MAVRRGVNSGDDLEEDDDGRLVETKLTSEFIQMWPREIFHTKAAKREGRKGSPPLLARECVALKNPGVYILYRDDRPFYIGQTQLKSLFSRIRSHAITPQSRRYLFWNYFSAYAVEKQNARYIDELEAILIAAMPLVLSNSARPKLRKAKMDAPVLSLIRRLRMVASVEFADTEE
jgi:hypothetical protein